MIIDTLGGRKFIVTASTGFLTCVLTWAGKIDDGIFATVILGTVGAYITGNVVDAISARGTFDTKSTKAKK